MKAENNAYDLDNAFDYPDRSKELIAAIAQGTRVIWLLTPQKRINFFGSRSVYVGYANETAKQLVESGTLREKESRHLMSDRSNRISSNFRVTDGNCASRTSMTIWKALRSHLKDIAWAAA